LTKAFHAVVLLMQVAFNLFLAGYVIQSMDITQASLLIAATEVGIVSKTTNIGLSFTSIGSAAGLTLNNKPHIKKPLSFPSTAFQNATSGGKLQVGVLPPSPSSNLSVDLFSRGGIRNAHQNSCLKTSQVPSEKNPVVVATLVRNHSKKLQKGFGCWTYTLTV
jgi:hypothetical protein